MEDSGMKYLIIILLCLSLTGCATVAHKDIRTRYNGFGVSVEYDSRVTIDSADIPAFIRAVDKLEKLLDGE
jgi:uncharacterized protein YceK